MKRNIVWRVFLSAIFLLSVAAPATAKDHRSCSSAGVAGEWGYTETGSAIITGVGMIPAAAVGKYTFDAAGNFTGTQYSSTGGNIAADKKEGTYIVNPDCTGTLNLRVYNQSGTLLRSSIWVVVYDDNTTEMRGIMTSLVKPNGPAVAPIMTLSGRKVLPDRGYEQ